LTETRATVGAQSEPRQRPPASPSLRPTEPGPSGAAFLLKPMRTTIERRRASLPAARVRADDHSLLAAREDLPQPHAEAHASDRTGGFTARRYGIAPRSLADRRTSRALLEGEVAAVHAEGRGRALAARRLLSRSSTRIGGSPSSGVPGHATLHAVTGSAGHLADCSPIRQSEPPGTEPPPACPA
jgi:hypothetical protein